MSASKNVFFDALKPLFREVNHVRELTIGVEQEFFLCDRAGHPATHEQSQVFLRSFERDASAMLIEEDDPGIGRHIAYADVVYSGERIRFKYDHHPHLMEIELPPVGSIGRMHKLLKTAMDIALRQAEVLGLQAWYRPFLQEPIDHAVMTSKHSLCVALREYRKQVNANRPEIIIANPEWINFSAYITATHFHFGGVGWSELEKVVNGLYCIEPEITQWSWLAISEFSANGLQKRWQGYQNCLGHLPLVAFPDLPEWTFDYWFEALCRMPLADTGDNHHGGGVDLCAPMSWFRAKRDVTLIKPRHYGTVEFRVDPCQPTAEAVAMLCAIRLGVTVEILEGFVPEQRFSEAGKTWKTWKNVNEGHLHELATSGLRKRGLNEEIFLHRE